MITDAHNLSQELPKKIEFQNELSGLSEDMKVSINEIFGEIDKDYEAFKTKINSTIDDIRDNLKTKFQQEIENRTKEIDSLSEKLEKVKNFEALEEQKAKDLDKLVEDLGDSPHIGNEFYFMLYNYLNTDKNHEKSLKNTLIEIEEYKKLYKSKKFEAYGKLF